MKCKLSKMVLLLCPIPESKGGVANYYRLFRKYFESDKIEVEYFFTGKKIDNPSFLVRIQHSLKDLIYLCKICRRYDLIHLNPSFDLKSIIRDGVYHFTAKRIFRKRTLVFFRGWDNSVERLLSGKLSGLFKSLFNCDLALVLSTYVKARLLGMGYERDKVKLETTAYDRFQIINGFENGNKRKRIIFLSRFVKEKGCLETIKTIEFLKKSYADIHLNMVGDGEYMGFLKEYVNKNSLADNISFTSYLTGKQKYRILAEASVMLFPTYAEGMPNCILEAMAAGVPIVTRPVGGIPDIFEDGKNGFLVNSLDPEDFAKAIEKIWGTPGLWESISEYNMKYAEEKFEIRRVVKRIEKIYLDIIASK